MSSEYFKTYEVSNVLNISISKVRRLVKENFLTVDSTYQTFKKPGHLFAKVKVEALQLRLPKILAKWEEQKYVNIKNGRKTAAATRERNKGYIEFIKNEKDLFVEDISFYPAGIADLLYGSFYLFNLTYYLNNQKVKKTTEAISKLVDLKMQTLKMIIGKFPNQDCIAYSVIEGDNKRGQLVRFCTVCKNRAEKLKLADDFYARVQEYLHIDCADCLYEPEIKNYYSLLEIVISRDNNKLVFHIPYLEIEDLFENISQLPKRKKSESCIEEGYFRGIKISSLERRATPLSDIKKEVAEFIERHQNEINKAA